MAKTRAEVSDNGLARRLGEKVTVRQREMQTRDRAYIAYTGTLIYYPSSFGILLNHEETIPLREGDIVQLRTGGRFSHIKDYVYRA